MAHTPGPWYVGGASGNDGEAREIASESRCVAWTACTWDEDDGDVVTAEDDANARLIAAAPELLATLRFVLPVLERAACRGTIDAEGVNLELEAAREVQDAISKAEGRTE